MDTGTQDVEAYETGPSPGFKEYSISTGVVDVSAIGGYPVRKVQVVAGTGTLKCRTAKSGDTYVDATLSAGESVGPAQITGIGGTTAGTSGITKVRVYK
jgi:hypothetical protein